MKVGITEDFDNVGLRVGLVDFEGAWLAVLALVGVTEGTRMVARDGSIVVAVEGRFDWRTDGYLVGVFLLGAAEGL